MKSSAPGTDPPLSSTQIIYICIPNIPRLLASSHPLQSALKQVCSLRDRAIPLPLSLITPSTRQILTTSSTNPATPPYTTPPSALPPCTAFHGDAFIVCQRISHNSSKWS